MALIVVPAGVAKQAKGLNMLQYVDIDAGSVHSGALIERLVDAHNSAVLQLFVLLPLQGGKLHGALLVEPLGELYGSLRPAEEQTRRQALEPADPFLKCVFVLEKPRNAFLEPSLLVVGIRTIKLE